jgi:hypothetical protein
MEKTMRLRTVPLAIALLVSSGASVAQSGRATLHGWVDFEGVAYVDVQPRAHVLLQAETEGARPYEATTDEHGFYDLNVVSLGRFRLRISAPGFEDYSTELYLSSDVAANLPVQLRARHGTAKAKPTPG